jgi:hypothetical protein
MLVSSLYPVHYSTFCFLSKCDGIVKSQTTKLRVVKTEWYEARNVLFVVFSENDKMSFENRRRQINTL